MAYRKLCGVVFVALGVLTAACGSGPGRNLVEADDDGSLPSSSDDQPPSNPDRPTSNGDQAPPNPDQPPANPDQPDSPGGIVGGGGSLVDLCENVCHAVEQCNDTDIGMDLRQICASGCKVQEGGTTAPTIPCESQFVDLLGCAFDAAGGECPTEANEAALEQQCGGAGRAYSSCLQAVDDDDDNDPDPPVGMCTETGGCEGCPNACATCACEATGDQEATIACLMSDACTMP